MPTFGLRTFKSRDGSTLHLSGLRQGSSEADIRKILEPNRMPLQAKSLLSSEKTLTLFKNYGSYLASADGEILPAPAA